jgi:hypothetical protein
LLFRSRPEDRRFDGLKLFIDELREFINKNEQMGVGAGSQDFDSSSNAMSKFGVDIAMKIKKNGAHGFNNRRHSGNRSGDF